MGENAGKPPIAPDLPRVEGLLTVAGEKGGDSAEGPPSAMPRLLAILALAGLTAAGACAPRAPARPDVFQDVYNGPYRLAAGDRVRVIVFGQDNLSNIYSVTPAGQIAFPLTGDQRAAGLTARDLERQLEQRLRQGFLREPKVSVEVDAFRPVFVLGEVTAAGQFPFVPGITVYKAIATAGGYTARAQESTAEVTRLDPTCGCPITATVPVGYPVQPGDTITVRERFF